MRPVLFMVVALIVGCGGGDAGKPAPVAAPVGPVVSASPEPKPVEAGDSPAEITNSIGMRLKLIPAGEFLMGSPETEADRRDHEKQHRVRITKPFYLGVYEVTQAEYERVTGTNPSKFKGDKNPVEQVTWDETLEFCRRLSELPTEESAGHVYRLPTEAEWEYACRAGTATAYSFGESGSALGEYAWYTGNSGLTTHPVGEKRPNKFGLYDMHGNVWEWCSDWYDWYGEYSGDVVIDPQGSTTGAQRLYRGGSWGLTPAFVRSASRNGRTPRGRSIDLGFRLARSSVK